jgi:PAS domain S-box-containing protein
MIEPPLLGGDTNLAGRGSIQDTLEAESEPERFGHVAELPAAVARAPNMPMLVTDPREIDNPVVFANDAFCRLTGYARDEIIGRNVRFLQGPETDPATVASIRAAVRAAEPIEVDIRNYRQNGEPFWNRLLIAPIYDASGTLKYFFARLSDITAERSQLAAPGGQNAVPRELAARRCDCARELVEANSQLTAEIEARVKVESAFRRTLEAANQAQTALMESEMHLRSVLDTSPDAMIVIDGKARIQSFSVTAECLFGYSRPEVIGRNISMLMPSPYREQHDEYLALYCATGEKRVISRGRIVVGLRKDGSTFPMELTVGETVSGNNRWFTGFARDLTEREDTRQRMQSMQAELIHMSRFTAMGEMASTLAHELNQPLTAVVSYLNGSRRLLMGTDNLQTLMIRDAIERAAEQALRAGQIIRRLRQFVARGESERHVENLTKLIEDACALALVGIKETGVKVAFALEPRTTFVFVDKVQIHQVLLNLIRNAIEAMQEASRQKLTIATARHDGDFAEIRVIDTGPGIAPAIASQLFRPFVTTKPQGMGVGLSISRTIVEAHGGHLSVEPNPDGGTIFCLTLKTLGKAELGNHA